MYIDCIYSNLVFNNFLIVKKSPSLINLLVENNYSERMSVISASLCTSAVNAVNINFVVIVNAKRMKYIDLLSAQRLHTLRRNQSTFIYSFTASHNTLFE